MELTIEQVLQQGVAAHKKGKLEEAERLYRAILQSQPKHPDASHNLGLIAVSVNKADVALPLFKTSLEANAKIEQFWLSYIGALIKEKQFENAKEVLEQANKQGVAGEKLNILEVQLASINKPGNVINITPSQQQLSILLEQYQNGRLEDAEKLAVSITNEFPTHQFGWKVLGAVLKKTSRLSESLVASQKSVQLAPKDAEAHCNLGATLKELGRLDEAETSCRQAIAIRPDYAEAYSNLANILQELGRLFEAEANYKKAIALKLDYAEAHYNLGVTLRELGRLDDAEESYKQAIVLKPDFSGAHNNLGVTLQELGRLDEAETCYRQAIASKPDYAEAYSNFGITLQKLGRLDEAEASYTQALALKPDYAEAYSNLGNTLKELDRVKEAEASYKQAIALKPDYAEPLYNLGNTLQELGRLDEAEANHRQAIALKPDYAEAHSLLGCLLHKRGDIDAALDCFEKAFKFDSNLRINELRLMVLKSRANQRQALENSDTHNKVDNDSKLHSNPLILNRAVEIELIEKLYEMTSRTLDNTRDARFGNGSCSLNFQLFEDESSIIKTVSADLIRILSDAVKSKVYVYDSFFNILGAGGGTHPHNHLKIHDNEMDLWKEKYSLVYYLSVGDQDCSKPGVLKLYSPDEDILPCEGMIVIVPATRQHSAIYGGKTDRVMVGVNFYTL